MKDPFAHLNAFSNALFQYAKHTYYILYGFSSQVNGSWPNSFIRPIEYKLYIFDLYKIYKVIVNHYSFIFSLVYLLQNYKRKKESSLKADDLGLRSQI